MSEGDFKDLSVNDMNDLRAKLGLKPLKVNTIKKKRKSAYQRRIR